MTATLVYISGPKTPSWEAYNGAYNELLAHGYIPVDSSTLFGLNTDREYAQAALPQLLACSAVLMLPGWAGDARSRMEYLVAQYADIPIYEDLNKIYQEVERPWKN